MLECLMIVCAVIALPFVADGFAKMVTEALS